MTIELSDRESELLRKLVKGDLDSLRDLPAADRQESSYQTEYLELYQLAQKLGVKLVAVAFSLLGQPGKAGDKYWNSLRHLDELAQRPKFHRLSWEPYLYLSAQEWRIFHKAFQPWFNYSDSAFLCQLIHSYRVVIDGILYAFIQVCLGRCDDAVVFRDCQIPCQSSCYHCHCHTDYSKNLAHVVSG